VAHLRLALPDDNIFTGILPARRQLPAREDLREWLSPPDPSINHGIACTKGTATWFTQCSAFFEWRSKSSLLWVSGNCTFSCTHCTVWSSSPSVYSGLGEECSLVSSFLASTVFENSCHWQLHYHRSRQEGPTNIGGLLLF